MRLTRQSIPSRVGAMTCRFASRGPLDAASKHCRQEPEIIVEVVRKFPFDCRLAKVILQLRLAGAVVESGEDLGKVVLERGRGTREVALECDLSKYRDVARVRIARVE